MLEQQLADYLGLTASFKQGLKIPFQMCPTHLAAQCVKAAIGRPSIRTQNTCEIISQQAFDPFSTAGGQHQEDGHQRSRSYPQPGSFAHLMPTSFIHIDTRLLAGIGFGFFHRCFQCSTDRLLLRRNTAQANFGVKADFHQFCYIPITHSEPPTQIADHRLCPWPKTAFWHIFRPLSACFCSTYQATQGMQLVLGNDWLRLRQFTYLVASRMRIVSQQQGATLVASVWFAHHSVLNLLWRSQLASMSVMSLLPPSFSPRGFAFRLGWRLGPIRRGGLGRITRILVDLLPQPTHLNLQPGNLFLQHGYLGDNRYPHCDWYSFPIFLGNRLTGRQIHIQSLLRDLPLFYCLSSSKMRLFDTCIFGFISN